MALPWNARNYVELGDKNVFGLLGRRILDGKTGDRRVMMHCSLSVGHRDLNRK